MSLAGHSRVTTHLGGFTPERVAKSEHVFMEERRLRVSQLLLDHVMQVRKLLLAAVFDDAFCDFVFEEALKNAALHGNNGDATKESSVVFEVAIRQQNAKREMECILSVTDHLPVFDMDKIPDPTAEENVHRFTGRGIFMLRKAYNVNIIQEARDGGKTMIYRWTVPVDSSDAA